MNQRKNLICLLKREPYEWVPVEFSLCPSLIEEYSKQTHSTLSYADYFQMPWKAIEDIPVPKNDSQYLFYYPNLKPGSSIDLWGVAHEPGSEAAKHMTYMRNPLKRIDSLDAVKAYPFPDYKKGDTSLQKSSVEQIHSKGLAAIGFMQVTIWETSWYIRGMEDLMMDMMSEDPIAAYILDSVTQQQIFRAVSFAKAGADMLYLGDDIGMQRTPMMSLDLYRRWIKPRLKQVIDAARAVNPNLIILYHSCGFVTPFIPDFIDVGIDVLNPIQPESMDFKSIYRDFGGKISFHGTIGTQTTMPFGTPEQVKQTLREHMEIAKPFGGLFPAPTHILEPEVPWENIIAYAEACKEYTVKG